MFLAKFESDWADEFSVYGFAVFSNAKMTKWNAFVEENGTKNISWSFGTNEGFEGISLEEFASSFEFIEIEKDQADAIQSLFGKDWGHFPDVFDLVQDDDNEDEEVDIDYDEN